MTKRHLLPGSRVLIAQELPTAEGRFVSVTGIKGYSGWLSRDDPTRPCTSGIAPVLGAGITPTLNDNKEGN